MPRLCYRCGNDCGDVDRVGRRDTCLQCGSDLHCCRNCAFHDSSFHNQCREPQAERQVDREAGNFCDYFAFRTGSRTASARTADAHKQLAELFRKPS